MVNFCGSSSKSVLIPNFKNLMSDTLVLCVILMLKLRGRFQLLFFCIICETFTARSVFHLKGCDVFLSLHSVCYPEKIVG